MLDFKALSTITAVIALSLCSILLFLPELLFYIFSIEESDSAFFIGRRAAMLFLGIAAFSWFGRNAEHSQSRQAICLGLAISMFSLATLGTIEFLSGVAGVGIWLAIVTELILASMYFHIWTQNRDTIGVVRGIRAK